MRCHGLRAEAIRLRHLEKERLTGATRGMRRLWDWGDLVAARRFFSEDENAKVSDLLKMGKREPQAAGEVSHDYHI